MRSHSIHRWDENFLDHRLWAKKRPLHRDIVVRLCGCDVSYGANVRSQWNYTNSIWFSLASYVWCVSTPSREVSVASQSWRSSDSAWVVLKIFLACESFVRLFYEYPALGVRWISVAVKNCQIVSYGFDNHEKLSQEVALEAIDNLVNRR